MITLFAIVASLLIAAVLVTAARKPDTTTVRRGTTINAAPEKIAPLIEDFHAWRTWSPYEKLDPALQRTYAGPSKGKGAVYEWEGNRKAGAGRMEIIDTSSSRLTIHLDFTKPFAGHNVAEFTFEPSGGATNVSWAMHCRSPYLMKVATSVFSMDRLVGRDFETGLANLKAIAEASA